VIEFPSRIEQLKRELVKVTQMEAHSAGSKDVGGEVVVGAGAAVPDSAVDASILRVKQVEVEFVTVVTAQMDFDL